MNRTNRVLLKGNEAAVYGALLAGCECYFGYPITPASEIAHASARLFPAMGRVFIQAECEIASINMVMGASAAGKRVMTASSGLGISLKQEGVSYIATAELPCVIVDVMRGGPGLGNISPEQADYNQVVKGGGHGGYRCIVLAPGSVQEMCDFTMLAFDLDTIEGREIIVRRAADGEKFVTLDGQERTMDHDVLMICDGKKAVGIGGIMGGENSMITDQVKTVLFEAANFNGPNIRLSAKRIGLRTDASGKFEKGLDPNNASAAIDRACQLMEELGAGEVVGGMVDVCSEKREPSCPRRAEL